MNYLQTLNKKIDKIVYSMGTQWDITKNLPEIEEFLNLGADPNKVLNHVLESYRHNYTAHLIKVMVKHGAQLNNYNQFGSTILSRLISFYLYDEIIELIEFLIENGAN